MGWDVRKEGYFLPALMVTASVYVSAPLNCDYGPRYHHGCGWCHDNWIGKIYHISWKEGMGKREMRGSYQHLHLLKLNIVASWGSDCSGFWLDLCQKYSLMMMDVLLLIVNGAKWWVKNVWCISFHLSWAYLHWRSVWKTWTLHRNVYFRRFQCLCLSVTVLTHYRTSWFQ